MCPAGREMMGGFICKRRKKRKKKKQRHLVAVPFFFFFFFFVFFCVWPFYLSPLKTPKECEMAGCAVPIGVHSIARESTSQQVNTKLTEKKVKKKEKLKAEEKKKNEIPIIMDKFVFGKKKTKNGPKVFLSDTAGDGQTIRATSTSPPTYTERESLFNI